MLQKCSIGPDNHKVTGFLCKKKNIVVKNMGIQLVQTVKTSIIVILFPVNDESYFLIQ